MNTAACLVLWGILVGCSAPSLHGIHTDDNACDDPSMVGVWTDDDTVATVKRTGFGEFDVRVLVSGSKGSTAITFDAYLVELEGVRFADLVLGEEQRAALFDGYAGLAVRTHQFVKVDRDGDTLTIWAPVDEKLLSGKGALEHAKLRSSKGGPKAIITASTSRLQKFFEAHGRDDEMFEQSMVMHRIPRVP